MTERDNTYASFRAGEILVLGPVSLDRALRRAIKGVAARVRDCPTCSKRFFAAGHGGQRYCSDRCRWRLQKRRHRARAKEEGR